MRTILSIVGARPQFVKHAPLQLQLQQHFNALTLHTGQHYDDDMSRVFFDELHIPRPDYTLDISGVKAPGEQTGIMMAGIEDVCQTLRPDAVLVYGDTNSTLAGALVAAKMQIPYIHVEAGIRSYNRDMPEEVNRIIADTFAALLLCPIPEAVENLSKEGIAHSGIYMTGDVMCDILEMVRKKILPPMQEAYYFCTIHRPYNTDDPERLARILTCFNILPHPVIFPLHPRTRSRMGVAGLKEEDFPNIRFTKPMGYLECLSHQQGAECVITDSGGIQKEAYMLRKKCITLRTETEWNDTLMHGWNTLVFQDIESISRLVDEKPQQYIEDMFGEGQAAVRIASIIRTYFERC